PNRGLGMAARVTNRTERLIKMEQLLFRNAAGLRAVELAQACDVDRRTVYRDLSLLGEVGVPIYQKDGRFCLEREQYLATIRVSFDETVALLLAASMSQQENPHLMSAMAKLSGALPDPVAAHASVLTQLAKPQAADKKRVEILDTITRAWAEQRCLKLWYRSRDDSRVKQREVLVYFIEPRQDGVVYVVGLDSLTERVRAFKLSRVQRVQMLKSTYKLPFHFDTKKYLFNLRDASKSRGARADDHSA
ncbi:MAG: WYL domain-containing protein, partial [Chloroflexota bacterium]